jgi:pyruvate carboxylase
MRAVASADEMPQAYARCRGEAEAAFGDGTLFVEKLVERPRHVEVQALGDAHGHLVHLHERDCSVQLRNQKVVEVALAPNLDAAVRERMCTDAVRLLKAADYVSAGTVEFLVEPKRGEYWFIECNPRIQVEHTITEQVTGVDLVEAQFRIAAGATLADLGIADQRAVGAPRGFAVQARVVATGAGTLSGYREPSGVGIRVDANGYLGYAPPPPFDPVTCEGDWRIELHRVADVRARAHLPRTR